MNPRPTIIPAPCGRQFVRIGNIYTCGDSITADGILLRCNSCRPLGYRLAAAGSIWADFQDQWHACLAWNLCFGALLEHVKWHGPHWLNERITNPTAKIRY